MIFPAVWALLAMGGAAFLIRSVGWHREGALSPRQRAWIEVAACVVGVVVFFGLVTLQEVRKPSASSHSRAEHNAPRATK
jgi:hypothetical protein